MHACTQFHKQANTHTHTPLAIGILNMQFVSDPLMVTRSETHVVSFTMPAFITARSLVICLRIRGARDPPHTYTPKEVIRITAQKEWGRV